MAETSAASRVFSIPELLNEILSYLPQSCLLLQVSRVCKTWAMALTSPGIERALCFRPAIHNGPTTWSSLLEEKFGIFFDFTYLSNGHVLCPGQFDSLPWKRNHHAFKRADASWRDMLVFSTTLL
ncbi:hypothetical protein EYC84_003263 [Monilinia fructicola]|uniref:F-box domain-containing protein n=1 Tax=Monilinia fructicola TaxID=38448 RepID=A0A5M9JX08_MONFR|nr:hypothetical protein EYC84_003263 [Monilinia fructicola]